MDESDKKAVLGDIEVLVAGMPFDSSANALPTIKVPKAIEMNSPDIVRQIRDSITKLGAVFDANEGEDLKYNVDTVSFSFAFNLEGKVQLIASTGAKSESAILVTLKRKPGNGTD